VATRASIVVSVVDEGIGRCSPAVEAAIYFCSVEAIQNAIKHGGSEANVAVTLGRDGLAVHFAIVDTGVGITQRPGVGMGLASMRDRIGAVGGELEIISTRGRGTTVRGTVPDKAPERMTEREGAL
jgi:signal transduction histidine kinase